MHAGRTSKPSRHLHAHTQTQLHVRLFWQARIVCVLFLDFLIARRTRVRLVKSCLELSLVSLQAQQVSHLLVCQTVAFQTGRVDHMIQHIISERHTLMRNRNVRQGVLPFVVRTIRVRQGAQNLG